MAQVSREILLCLLMAISATFTTNLTIGLLLSWAQTEKVTSYRSGFKLWPTLYEYVCDKKSPKKNDKVALGKARKNRLLSGKHDRYACATRPRLHSLQFHLGTEFVFSLHHTDQNEMSFQNDSFIRHENRNELNPEWLVQKRNVVSVSWTSCKRNEYVTIAVNSQLRKSTKKKKRISGLQRDSNPWPLRERCSALPAWAMKTHTLEAGQLLKLRFTAMVTYSFHLYSRSSHHFILCIM